MGHSVSWIGYGNKCTIIYNKQLTLESTTTFLLSSNPFAFYTQCIKNSFIQFLKLEQYQRDVRDKILVKQGLSPSHGYIDREKGAIKEKEKKKEEAAQEKKNQQLVEC